MPTSAFCDRLFALEFTIYRVRRQRTLKHELLPDHANVKCGCAPVSITQVFLLESDSPRALSDSAALAEFAPWPAAALWYFYYPVADRSRWSKRKQLTDIQQLAKLVARCLPTFCVKPHLKSGFVSAALKPEA